MRSKPSANIWQKNQSYKIWRGIRDYSTSDYYWNQIPRLRMTKLIDLSAKLGYKKALEVVYAEAQKDKTLSSSVKRLLTPEHFKTYILDEKRSRFADLLPLPKGVKVLDLGCGWGAVAISLAKKIKQIGGEIYGLDATKETLAFIGIRAEQESLKNIFLSATDPFDYGKFPFQSAKFDVVLMNGVLEWVGLGRKDLSPRECQKLALKEVFRVLKPGGVLYVGIENSAAYDYYLGQKDHSGLRFVGCFPKWLANIVSLVVKKEPYRTYIYNSKEYKKLFKEIGFYDTKFFVPVPSYRNIQEIVNFDDSSVRKAFEKYWKLSKSSGGLGIKRAILSVLMKLPGASRHAYSFSMLNYKK